ncbi:MAG: 2-oxo acid dehydrogenase subunit E2 [Bacteroidales bacterium]|nr:2-oxo acid dehydrogenase subunit E2 [Bacteroidales bacterium]
MNRNQNTFTANRGFSTELLSFNRKMVAASASVSHRKNIIHSLAQADVTEARRMIRAHDNSTGEKLSFTAYVVKCLAEVIADHKKLNSFIRYNRLIVLEDVNVSVLVEREFEGEKVPEPVCIRNADQKSYREISAEIRESVSKDSGNAVRLGGLQGMGRIRFIPAFLLKSFVRMADRNIRMAKKYGKVAVTAVGMFSREPVWFIPHGSATVLITVGSIEKRMVTRDGIQEEREYLCITGSFDHNIMDGAPAARFMNQLLETLRSGISHMM